MFENFSEKLADGTLKAEPLSLVVSLFELQQQEYASLNRRGSSTISNWIRNSLSPLNGGT